MAPKIIFHDSHTNGYKMLYVFGIFWHFLEQKTVKSCFIFTVFLAMDCGIKPDDSPGAALQKVLVCIVIYVLLVIGTAIAACIAVYTRNLLRIPPHNGFFGTRRDSPA